MADKPEHGDKAKKHLVSQDTVKRLSEHFAKTFKERENDRRKLETRFMKPEGAGNG